MSNEMDFTYDFERQVSNDLIRGIGRWQRRRRARARVGALTALILVFGGGAFALFGSLGAEPPAEVASDAIGVAPTATATGDDSAGETEPEQSTEPASTAQSVTADQPGTDAVPVAAGDVGGTENSTFTTGERGARRPAADPTSPQLEPGSDDEATVADVADSPAGVSDDTDEDPQSSEPDASVTTPPDAAVPEFEISSVSFEGDARAITAIVELTHEPACLQAVFEAQDWPGSYTIDVTERDDCAGKPETTWGALTLGAIEPGIGRFELNGTLWEFIVPAPLVSDDEALPESEIELTLAASDITIEYAKYRDDYERNQADPGSYLASIATITTLVPDCYTLTAEPGPNDFEVTVTAVLDVASCDGSGSETMQTVEIALPGSATSDVGRRVALINDEEVAFFMGDYTAEAEFEDVILIRNPTDIGYSPSAIGLDEYALVWQLRGDGCTTWVIEPDPDRAGEWISYHLQPAELAPPPNESYLICAPVQGSIGLGLETTGIPEPVTINGRTFTPIELDFDLFSPFGQLPPADQFRMLINLGPVPVVTLTNFGELSAEGLIAVLSESLPSKIYLEARASDPLCSWFESTTVTANPATPIVVQVWESCS